MLSSSIEGFTNFQTGCRLVRETSVMDRLTAAVSCAASRDDDLFVPNKITKMEQDVTHTRISGTRRFPSKSKLWHDWWRARRAHHTCRSRAGSYFLCCTSFLCSLLDASSSRNPKENVGRTPSSSSSSPANWQSPPPPRSAPLPTNKASRILAPATFFVTLAAALLLLPSQVIEKAPAGH